MPSEFTFHINTNLINHKNLRKLKCLDFVNKNVTQIVLLLQSFWIFVYIYIYASQFLGSSYIYKRARCILLMGVIFIFIYIPKPVFCEDVLYTKNPKTQSFLRKEFFKPQYRELS